MGQEAYIIFKTSPFNGYKLGVEFAGKMVFAIPQKRIDEAKKEQKNICVIQKLDKYLYKKRKKKNTIPAYQILDPYEIPIAFAEFEDKWGREERYMLCYFEWKPTVQQTLF